MLNMNEEGSINDNESVSTRVSYLINSCQVTTINRPRPHPRQEEEKKEPARSSAVNQEALQNQKRLMETYERQKQAKAINVPSNDDEVKMALRQLRQPICLFGEDAIARRERLKGLAQKAFIQDGRIPLFGKPKENKEQKAEKETFYTHGTEELKAARLEIALYSVPKSTMRIEMAKKKRHEQDRIEEASQYSNYISKYTKYDIQASQYGDDRCIAKGTLSPDEKLFGTAGWSGVCKIWGIPDCKMKYELKGHTDKAFSICFHPNSCIGLPPNGPNIATASADRSIRLWSLNPELEQQQSIVLGHHEERVNCVAFHPLGHYLASSSHDKTWRLWNIEHKKEILIQEGHEAAIMPLSFQSDGALIATGDLNGVGLVWDLRTGRCVLNLVGHVKRILSLAFLPNSYQVATGSDDNTIRIWDLRRKNSISNIPAHHGLVSDIRFEPTEGKFMVTSSYDGLCKVWNTKEWNWVAKFAGHESKMTSATPNKDASMIITTSSDKTFKLWTLAK